MAAYQSNELLLDPPRHTPSPCRGDCTGWKESRGSLVFGRLGIQRPTGIGLAVFPGPLVIPSRKCKPANQIKIRPWPFTKKERCQAETKAAAIILRSFDYMRSYRLRQLVVAVGVSARSAPPRTCQIRNLKSCRRRGSRHLVDGSTMPSSCCRAANHDRSSPMSGLHPGCATHYRRHRLRVR